jgi:lipopolysaccharide/colanic/teichoic acid biosynthesis glycosyltransferase
MQLMTWFGACSLLALAAGALSSNGGPQVLGVAAIFAAQAGILAGRAGRLPYWVVWPAAIGCATVGALGKHGVEVILYLGLVALMLVLIDRFAALSVDLSTFCLPRGGARGRDSKTMLLTDPVAREFAHVRRQGSPLTVASISVPTRRGASRQLARIARALLPSLRRTDVIVRALKGRLVVLLPGGDEHVAASVLDRSLAGESADVFVGIATFPHDGPTFASLREIAQAREQPWSDAGGPRGGGRPDPPAGEVAKLHDPARGDGTAKMGERPPMLFETRSITAILRRAADLLALVLTAPVVVPVIALLALAVKLDSPGPAFVRITRVGRGGKPFELLKLRSMIKDADKRKEELRHLNILPWPDFKVADDPRITRAGRWLRRYSLDELPQLYNVLRGEMTLVGPRPCSVELASYETWQGERLEAIPGLAGRWQADARGSADFAGRCRLDIRQAETGSVRVSLMLIAATLRSVVRARGAL